MQGAGFRVQGNHPLSFAGVSRGRLSRRRVLLVSCFGVQALARSRGWRAVRQSAPTVWLRRPRDRYGMWPTLIGTSTLQACLVDDSPVEEFYFTVRDVRSSLNTEPLTKSPEIRPFPDPSPCSHTSIRAPVHIPKDKGYFTSSFRGNS